MICNKRDIADSICAYLTASQVGDEALWAKLTDQYKYRTDGKGQYKGEYWGKIMRGATLIYRHTHDQRLYTVLEKTVCDILSLCTDEGLSSYSPDVVFTAWDLWCRKYVAVGLEYFYDICASLELKERILAVLSTHLYAIMRHIGDGDGKKPITSASNNWGGLNSCSILKAFVVAYKLTDNRDFLDFASYIVSTGGSKDFDYVQAARDNVVPLHKYRYPKAYECTSFFEGLLEYAIVTDDSDLLAACINYGKSILGQEFTVVGCGGTDVECFSFSAVDQTRATKRPIQETCVTVSYMLYFHELYKVTHDVSFLDAMEKSFYNAYLGAIAETAPDKTYGLPIDWYSPLVHGRRSNPLTAGRQTFADRSIYSCCTAIGAAGVGVYLATSEVISAEKVFFNFYHNSAISAEGIVITQRTDYPVGDNISFSFDKGRRRLELYFRIPAWCNDFSLSVNDQPREVDVCEGYVCLSGNFGDGDNITLRLNMPYTSSYIPSTRFKGGFLTFYKGPLTLAADKRFTDIYTVFPLNSLDRSFSDFEFAPISNDDALCSVSVKCGKSQITLIDYASAGSTFDNRSSLNVFIPYRATNLFNLLKCYLDRHKLI